MRRRRLPTHRHAWVSLWRPAFGRRMTGRSSARFYRRLLGRDVAQPLGHALPVLGSVIWVGLKIFEEWLMVNRRRWGGGGRVMGGRGLSSVHSNQPIRPFRCDSCGTVWYMMRSSLRYLPYSGCGVRLGFASGRTREHGHIFDVVKNIVKRRSSINVRRKMLRIVLRPSRGSLYLSSVFGLAAVLLLQLLPFQHVDLKHNEKQNKNPRGQLVKKGGKKRQGSRVLTRRI